MDIAGLYQTKELRIPTRLARKSGLVAFVRRMFHVKQSSDVVINIKNEISWAEFVEVEKIEDPVKRGIMLSRMLVHSWNLEENGVALAVTDEVFEKLPAFVVMPLVAEVQLISEEKAKKKVN